jgi:hypothetical protein
MKSFEEDKGRYLTLDSHFGGAVFCFTTLDVDYVKNLIKENEEDYESFDGRLEWSYGKYGKVEFDEE